MLVGTVKLAPSSAIASPTSSLPRHTASRTRPATNDAAARERSPMSLRMAVRSASEKQLACSKSTSVASSARSTRSLARATSSKAASTRGSSVCSAAAPCASSDATASSTCARDSSTIRLAAPSLRRRKSASSPLSRWRASPAMRTAMPSSYARKAS